MPEDVDYISTGAPALPNNPANVGPGSNPTAVASTNPITRVPIIQQFNITCTPLYSRNSISKDFGFKKFAAGQLLANSSRGGFI